MTPAPTRAPDRVLAAAAEAGGLVARVARTTRLCEEARKRNGAMPAAADALARGLTGAVLVGSLLGAGQSVRLLWRGEGLLGAVEAEAGADLAARVRVSNPEAPERAVMGRGVLRIVTAFGPTEPVSTAVPSDGQDMGADLVRYFWTSGQVPSVVALGVRIGAGGCVEEAGGLLVSGAPGTPRHALRGMEETVAALGAGGERLWQGRDVEEVASLLFDAVAHRTQELGSPRLFCTCSADRVAAVVGALGTLEVEELRREGGEARLRCQACGFEWRVAL